MLEILKHGIVVPAANTPSATIQNLLVRSFQRVLRPLIRLSMRHGITYPMLSEMLRGLFVAVALDDLLLDPRDRTDSRVSLLTGIHRKEIKRLREQPLESSTDNAIVTLSSAIMARWLGADGYTDASGLPLALPRSAAANAPSFEALVQSITSDVRPRAVLDDWVSQELVTLDDTGMISLNTQAFIPKPGREEQLFYFARNLHDHVAAASANIQATDRATFLDRSVHYDRLPPEIAAQLHAAGREKAQQLLLDVNRLALELLDAHEQVHEQDGTNDLPAGTEPKPTPLTERFNLGIYSFIEAEKT